jgi:chromosome partitioning protein
MIITIASFKGGVGKSTTSIHLAQFLATRRGMGQVVLADGDPNHTSLNWSERSPDLKFQVFDSEDDLGEPNHIVIDTPARTEPEELKPLLQGSKLLIIPTMITAFSLEATITTLKGLDKPPKDRYRVLLTKVPSRSKSRESQAREALESVGIPVFKASIKDRIIYADGELAGLTVDRLKGNAAKAAWSDYEALGKEILKGWK